MREFEHHGAVIVEIHKGIYGLPNREERDTTTTHVMHHIIL
jgi:hypothetical protein